ncbi:conserved hypothetical protein [Nitrosomonas nitrosa]|uniref:Uncharacterized protein n=1 Tax=Nitrosomonas nitrosa TaxID=52442 RepID=A0A8H9DAR6_9PROT|nr:conserved hypothetical protein [Nitrosomonas nitrosa]
MGSTDVVRDVGCGFANQLQIAQGGIIGESARHETSLVESVGVGQHLSGEVDHIVEIETPFTLAGIRH